MSSTPATPPALIEATQRATSAWQADLQSLFDHAKDRFPDVVWELLDEEAEPGTAPEEVWGHKAVVYARAPPSFQARYFSFRPPPATSPVPYSSSPTGTLPAQSALSLTLGVDYGAISRSPSPFRAASPSPSTNAGQLLRLPTSINPTLFSNELEYLYTGKGFGAAFEFLFDTSETREEGDAEEARIDKLRKDLVFMWRSRLYSDVRIALTGTFSSHNHETTTAIFSSHRFMLVSRSPYFRAQLLRWNTVSKPGEPLTLNLPSPPFTPASLHFTLGFLYTGTLVFSHRTFDLDTAFHIMRSATYLSMDTLYDEIQARIVQEMMHGLFHAFLEFSEYENITGGKWGTGGCRCRQCARRAPRVLEFALSEDVKNPHLERGARRALVGLYGEGWCTPEFARLPQKLRDGLLKGLAKRTTPLNIFPLLYATHAALKKLDNNIEPWAEVVRDMVSSAQKTIDDVLASHAAESFEQPEWVEIMESNGARFEDGERVEWMMESLRRGMNEKNAAMLYQTLVGAILLKPHPEEPTQSMLSSTSHVRVQVEQTRMDVIRWLRRRWIGAKQEGGFDNLQDWALQEIAAEAELPYDDLVNPLPSTPTKSRDSARSPLPAYDNDNASMHSLRTSVLSKAVGKSSDAVKSSAASIRSVARSTHSTTSRASTVTSSSRLHVPPGPRPDSKLTPKDNSISTRSSVVSTRSSVVSTRSSVVSIEDRSKPRVAASSSSAASSRRSVASSVTSSIAPSERTRPKSSTGSVKSQASTSTLRRPAASTSSLRPSTAGAPRSPSALSSTTSTSDGSTAFETAKSEIPPSSAPRARTVSATSTTSTTSVRTTGAASVRTTRSRPGSSAATASPKLKRPAPAATDAVRLSPAARRTPSSTSLRSTTSTTSLVSRAAPSRRTPAAPPPKVPRVPSTTSTRSTVLKGKNAVVNKPTHEKQDSLASQGSASTVKGTLKRKSSNDTITESIATTNNMDTSQTIPRGATLEIGIPCIISSKRARFRAYARYIGEVEGEKGPWVGVEVPVSDDWPDEKLDDRQWNDGSWGGVRYFDLGSSASEWEYGDQSAMRRRRLDSINYAGSHGLKREGDQLSVDRAKRMRSASPAVSDMSTSEVRGLFVRPQQVLYVVDAVV
ncbi:hypothetical protein K474DRAFT_1668508 [Panus rudis PR-1116 ss-1]|nr:hypothetical protein K474DRAFT_1668508 [Panus rudis PR-1116 ss-1]